MVPGFEGSLHLVGWGEGDWGEEEVHGTANDLTWLDGIQVCIQ